MLVLIQAMGLMLPRSGDCPEGQAKSSLEGKLDCMSLNGYGSTARENVDLNRCAELALSAVQSSTVSQHASGPPAQHLLSTYVQASAPRLLLFIV